MNSRIAPAAGTLATLLLVGGFAYAQAFEPIAEPVKPHTQMTYVVPSAEFTTAFPQPDPEPTVTEQTEDVNPEDIHPATVEAVAPAPAAKPKPVVQQKPAAVKAAPAPVSTQPPAPYVQKDAAGKPKPKPSVDTTAPGGGSTAQFPTPPPTTN